MRTLGGRIAILVAALLLATAGTAAAYPPVETVHTEKVEAGPYSLTVGFSTWPLRAMQSLDFTFDPDEGIARKSGTLQVIRPGAAEAYPQRLARHPRKHEVWGLDVHSLPSEGAWTLRFTIDGPQGQGTGELRGLTVLEQPGPPMALSWAISTLPVVGLAVFLGVAWRRTSPPDWERRRRVPRGA